MKVLEQGQAYFKVGGTLEPHAPSYVTRPADDELFTQVMAGQFCYVLTPRQMGKSSLMLSTIERLQQREVRTAKVDLTSLGSQEVSSEEWYLSLIKCLLSDLKLATNPEAWWRERSSLTPVQRFTNFLHDVILAEIPSQVVIFIDEIDSTIGLPFADDFFAAIRFIYNRRASQPEYDRLTFVLLGVAAPTDLIQDNSRTPFNIGRAIDLQEFSRQDAQPLEAGLEQLYPGQGRRLLDRIFYWADGHPYLTQKLCQQAAETGALSEPQIDALVESLFLAEEGKRDTNLNFVRSHIERHPERRALLQLYRRVYQEQVVREDERSRPQIRLKLIGLVRVEQRVLRLRNKIYHRVFNPAWIKANMPFPWTQWSIAGAIIIIILASMAIYVAIKFQQQQQVAAELELYTNRFHNSTRPETRLNALAKLCEGKHQTQAQSLFFDLVGPEQLALFDQVSPVGAGQDVETVSICLYPALERGITAADQRQTLSRAMCCALSRWNEAAAQRFSRQTGETCYCRAEEEDKHE